MDAVSSDRLTRNAVPTSADGPAFYNWAMSDAEMVSFCQGRYGESDRSGRPNGPLQPIRHAASPVEPPQPKSVTGGPG